MTRALEQPTLILNRNWQPVNIATVARALVMLWNRTAHVVDPQTYQLFDWDAWTEQRPVAEEPYVQAVRQRLRVPEVVTLTSYDRIPAASVTFNRRNVFKRDRYTCQYCHKQPGSHELTIDHVVPRARGGQSTWTNCVLACLPCNARKADRTPEESQMKLLKEPRKPEWQPLYGRNTTHRASWSNFVSKSYWEAELEE